MSGHKLPADYDHVAGLFKHAPGTPPELTDERPDTPAEARALERHSISCALYRWADTFPDGSKEQRLVMDAATRVRLKVDE